MTQTDAALRDADAERRGLVCWPWERDYGEMLLHLDTDLGGDPDDVCALVMLLGWPGLELAGVTTTIDPGGRRAGCVEYVLALAGRGDVPVVAGAEMSFTTRQLAVPADDDRRYWPADLVAHPSSAGASLDALEQSIRQGAVITAIGPLTNLAALELLRPGALADAEVVVMGGWIDPPAAGLPVWGPEMDWNLQWDTRAAMTVFEAAGQLTLVTLPATLSAHLTARHIPRLLELGPVGELLARQSQARADDADMPALGKAHTGLPDDILNFHFDPVTCAVAAGWVDVRVEETFLTPALDDVLHLRRDTNGRPTRIITDVHGPGFEDLWLTAVSRTA